MSKRALPYLIVILVLIAAGGASLLLMQKGTMTPTITSTGKALVGGAFSLIDHTGKRVTEVDFMGGPTLVYFGFTYCPEVCPTELSRMTEVLELLGDDGETLTPIFITIDPERDTQAVMAEYVGHFHPRMVGLTGTPAEIAIAAKAYRVYYTRVEDEGSEGGYTMDHSALVLLMGANGDYLAHFPANSPIDEMIRKIRDLI